MARDQEYLIGPHFGSGIGLYDHGQFQAGRYQGGTLIGGLFKPHTA